MTTAVWLTSRQVHLGIVIYPRSNIFFQLCSYSTFATGRRETRDFHPPLNTFQVCIAGTRKILRFNFFPLKSVGKLQRFMPFLRGQPNTQDCSRIPPDTLMPDTVLKFTDLCFGIGRSSRERLRPR